jgi:heme/copper-type cytochrome/quinol oxidase subunit 3
MSRVLETIDPHGRRVLDVSELSESAMDSRSPVWWGNTLLIFIESTTVLLLLVSYFYLRRNFQDWPPPQPNAFPPLFHPVPSLPIPLIETILIVLACLPMYWTDMAARRLDLKKTLLGILLMLVITIIAIVMRFTEFHGSHFRWDDNAYGSLVWTLLGLHLTYLLAAGAEFIIMGVYMLRHGIDPKHALDVTLVGGTWYWLTGTWILVFATIYGGARFL